MKLLTKLLRGRYSFLILLTLTLGGLIGGFQNCAGPRDNHAVTDSGDGIVHKIDVESSAESVAVFDSNIANSEQGRNLIQSLPTNRPLVVLIRNGNLYPGVQLVVNDHSFLVSDYLNVLKLFSIEKPSVPLLLSPQTNAEVGSAELIRQIRLDIGRDVDSRKYCEALVSFGSTPQEGDLILQIADASSMLSGDTNTVLKVYWTLPLRIFSPSSCNI